MLKRRRATGAGRLLCTDLWPASDRNLSERHIQFETGSGRKSGVFFPEEQTVATAHAGGGWGGEVPVELSHSVECQDRTATV